MKMIVLKRLPLWGTANFIALSHILGLLVSTILQKSYSRVFWGAEVTFSGGNVPRLALFGLEYIVPIVAAWISGLFLAAVYNAIVKTLGSGLRLEIDE